MKQIDQDPGEYRFQKPDGSWGYRVNKPLCRWMGILSGSFAVIAALAPGDTVPLAIALSAFVSGALLTMSFRTID